DDAAKSATAVMAGDPDDHRIAYALGRQLRAAGRKGAAVEFLTRATKSKKLAARPDLAAMIWYDLAVLLEQDGKFTEAEDALVRVTGLLAKPEAVAEVTGSPVDEVRAQAAEVQERYGQVSLKLKKIDQARGAFDAARELDPTRSPRLAFDLARVYRDAGRHGEALKQLDGYLRSMPSAVEPYEVKIQVQRTMGRAADVLPELTASSDRDPNNVPLRLLLAKELVAGKRIAEAEAVYADLLAKNLTPEVYRGLFRLYDGQGASGAAKALARLDRAIGAAVGRKDEAGDATQAASARAMLTVLRTERGLVRRLLQAALGTLAGGKLEYVTKITLGTLAGRTNELATAERLYRACLEAKGEQLGGAEAELYSGLLQVLQLQHKNAAVIEVAVKGLERAHETNRLLFHRAMAYAHLALGNPKDALAAAELAVKEAGKDQMLGSRKVLIHVLCESGQKEKALEESRSLVREYNFGGDLREARLALSRTYQSMGRHDESEAELERVLALDPNDATVNNDLGYGLADRSKDLDRAEKLIRKAIELDRKERESGTAVDPDAGEDNAAFLDSLGWVLFRKGKLDEARLHLERASGLKQGEDPVIWDHLGDVYFRLKLPAKASEAWGKALALYELGARPGSDPRVKEIKDKRRALTP
ncbi:MAG: tetratricopeptide repeat protein, partial [Gemmataceae bacterium]